MEARSDRSAMREHFDGNDRRMMEQMAELARQQHQTGMQRVKQDEAATAQASMLAKLQEVLNMQAARHGAAMQQIQVQLENQQQKNEELGQSQQRILSFMNDELGHLKARADAADDGVKRAEMAAASATGKIADDLTRLANDMDARTKGAIAQSIQAQATRFASLEAAVSQLQMAGGKSHHETIAAVNDAAAQGSDLSHRIDELVRKRSVDEANMAKLLDRVRDEVGGIRQGLANEAVARTNVTGGILRDFASRIATSEQRTSGQMVSLTQDTKQLLEKQNAELARFAAAAADDLETHRADSDRKIGRMKSDVTQDLRTLQTATEESMLQLNHSAQLLEREISTARQSLSQVIEAEIRSRVKQGNTLEVTLSELEDSFHERQRDTSSSVDRLAQLTAKVCDETQMQLQHGLADTRSQLERVQSDLTGRVGVVVSHISKFEQDISATLSTIHSHGEEGKRHTDMAVLALQDRTMEHMKQLEGQVQAVPVHIQEAQNRVTSLRTEVYQKLNDREQEHGSEMDGIKLAIARKADAQVVDRKTTDLISRLRTFESKSIAVEDQVQRMEATKADVQQLSTVNRKTDDVRGQLLSVTDHLERMASTKADTSMIRATANTLAARIHEFDEKSNQLEDRLDDLIKSGHTSPGHQIGSSRGYANTDGGRDIDQAVHPPLPQQKPSKDDLMAMYATSPEGDDEEEDDEGDRSSEGMDGKQGRNSKDLHLEDVPEIVVRDNTIIDGVTGAAPALSAKDRDEQKLEREGGIEEEERADASGGGGDNDDSDDRGGGAGSGVVSDDGSKGSGDGDGDSDGDGDGSGDDQQEDYEDDHEVVAETGVGSSMRDERKLVLPQKPLIDRPEADAISAINYDSDGDDESDYDSEESEEERRHDDPNYEESDFHDEMRRGSGSTDGGSMTPEGAFLGPGRHDVAPHSSKD